MKNAALHKNKGDTPKTPGGISKSLLTPCRRVGLSRNWRKSVASPFNSPLSSPQVTQSNDETRKRKERLEETPQKYENEQELENTGTPVRKVELPRRKKSKTLLSSMTKTEDDSSQPGLDSPAPPSLSKVDNSKPNEENNKVQTAKTVATPVRLKTKSKSSNSLKNSDKANNELISLSRDDGKDKIVTNEIKLTPPGSITPVRLNPKNRRNKMSPKTNCHDNDINTDNSSIDAKNIIIEKEINEKSNKMLTEMSSQNNTDLMKENSESDKLNINKKSPNNLTKECIVIIQKKIFKNQLQEYEVKEKNDAKVNTVSQALFNDSDSDDIPLNKLSKPENDDAASNIDNDDFAIKPKLKKTKSKITLKETNVKQKTTKTNETTKSDDSKVNATSQSSVDDDDFFEKKTILIRKSYNKVVKPLKAKSTGSITQKDIEDLKARIETKKKMLLAKSMTDTAELRELIKKWQKGCQDALMELMELMKSKCPDQNMEYSQILQSLKIPASLVGYDSDNDCFVTPEDENIILSHIKQ